jgi:SAM-dependent methyltransferase
MASHWTEAYYGALYLESVEDLLTPALSAIEAEVIASLLSLRAGARVLDLACGQGRHARVVAGRVGTMVGVDRSGPYLRRAARSVTRLANPTPNPPLYVQADLRALPFRSSTFDAAYSWYASLFMFDDAENAAALGELARVVRPGGRLLVHHANPLALALNPHETARRTLADGSVVVEDSVFDPGRGVDRCTRRLVRPGGDALEATAHLRYYKPSEWRTLARAASLRLVRVTSTTDAAARGSSEPGPEAPDLIALLEKPT